MTAAIRNTWSLRSKPWRGCRMIFPTRMRRRCFAPASPRSTRFGTVARCPADLVAIQGVGGLGHLGIQFARKFGFHVVAIGRGADNADLAAKLGAHRYLDSKAVNPAEELTKMGGARVILTTAPNGKSMSALIDGLGPNGTMVVVGAGPEAIEVTPLQLIQGKKKHSGMGLGNSDGFGRYFAIRRVERGSSHDRKVPPVAGERRLRPHDERQGAVPGCPDYETVSFPGPQSVGHQRLHCKFLFRSDIVGTRLPRPDDTARLARRVSNPELWTVS